MLKKLVTALFAALVLALSMWAAAADFEESSVSTPNISVTTSTGSATFTLKSDSKGANIYYTTDGSDPSSSDKKYSRSVKVTKSCEVRAVAYEGGEYSPVGYYTVTVTRARVATPTLTATNVDGGKKITIRCSGATIYYTLDGSTPTASDYKYTSSGIIVSESCIIKAIGVRSGYQNSAVATGTVKITQLDEPEVTKTTSKGKTVYKLSGPVSGCTYYYTTDGSDPTPKTSSRCKKYSTSGISITKDCVIRVIACKAGYAPSDIYEIDAEGEGIPVPTGNLTNVIGGKKLTMKSSLSGVTFYYTLDDTAPSTDSKKYTSSGILITEPGTTYVRVLAVKSGYSDRTFELRVSLSQLDAPRAKEVSSSSSSTSRSYKITGPSGSTIYYTTNGTMPTTSSKKVASGGTIKLSGSFTLNMIAAKKGYANSEVYSIDMNINQKVATPTVSESKYTDYNKITLRCSTSGATILYTLDGSDPLYFGEEVKSGTSFRVEQSCVLKAIAIKDGYDKSSMIMYQVALKGEDVTPLGTDMISWSMETDYDDGGLPVIDEEYEGGDFPDLDDEEEVEFEDMTVYDGEERTETVKPAATGKNVQVEIDFSGCDDAIEL